MIISATPTSDQSLFVQNIVLNLVFQFTLITFELDLPNVENKENINRGNDLMFSQICGTTPMRSQSNLLLRLAQFTDGYKVIAFHYSHSDFHF